MNTKFENATGDVHQFEEELTAVEVQLDSSKRKLDIEMAYTGMKRSKVEENVKDMRKIVDEILEQAYDLYKIVEINCEEEMETEEKICWKENIGKDDEHTETGAGDIKTAILDQLSGLESNATAAAGWLDKNVPNQPLVYVEGYGTVGLPVNSHVAMELSKYMEQAPYGMGEETVLDKTVRDSLQIGPDKFAIVNKKFVKAVNTIVVDRVKQELGLNDIQVWVEPYKLLLYEPEGHFKPHRDTEKCTGMFGTLIVQLPSQFTGGDLVIRHGGKEVVIDMAQEGSCYYCVLAAHYSDVLHELKPVVTGYRLALVYSLCWSGAGQAPSTEIMVDKATYLQSLLTKYFSTLKSSAPRLCWGLEHLYSSNSLDEGGASVLKGADRNVVETIMAANLKLDNKDQFEMFLAQATMVEHDFGECTCGHDKGRWASRCEGRCFEKYECMGVDIKLKDFVSLSGSKFDLESDISPEEEVLNFESKFMFWGEGSGECSGPSGNEGATMDMWYRKWVLVMWRKSDGFVIKCNVSIKAGLQHVLNTCQEGDMVNARQEVMHLLDMKIKEKITNFKKNFTYYEVKSTNCKETPEETALIVALAIDDENLCKQLVRKFVESDPTESVMTRLQSLIAKYTWPILDATILELFDKVDISHIGNFAKLFAGVVNPPESLCTEVIKKLAGFRPIASSIYSYCSTENSLSSTKMTQVLDFILRFPTKLSMLGRQFSNTPSLSSLSLCADLVSFLATKTSATPLLAVIEERFLREVVKIPKLSQEIVAVTRLASVMVSLGRETSLQSLSRLVLAQADHQTILSHMLSTTTATSPQKSATLVIMVRARVVFLQSLIGGGPPQFSWRQSKAVVAKHPLVEKFFRSDQQKFIYRGFPNIRKARSWANMSYSGTSATLTPGGSGGKAYVEVVKKKEGFDQMEMNTYKSNLTELTRLLAFLPSSANQPMVLPSSTISLTISTSLTTSTVLTTSTSLTTKSSTPHCSGETIDLTTD